MRTMCGSSLAGQRIRVRFSALINFLTSIYRNLVSIIFTLIVIRRLSPSDYGLYSVALYTSNALNTPNNVWISWSSRRHVLGVSISPKAYMILGLLYLAISIPLYIYIVAPLARSSENGFLIVTLIIVFYMLPTPLALFYSLVGLHAPEKNGYLVLLFETVRVILTYILIIVLGSGVVGAIVGPGLAGIVLIMASMIVLLRAGVIGVSILNIRRNLRESLGEAMNIVRLSVLSIPSAITVFLLNLDRYLMSLIASSTLPAAFASVSSTPKSIITPGSFTLGLYAKMLRDPNKQDATDMIILYSFVSIFIASIFSLLSIPAITFFNPLYVSGHVLLIMASIEALITGYAAIFETIAMGSERADISSRKIREVMGTPLGRIPLAQMLRAVLSISAAIIAQAMMYSAGVRDPVILVLPYSISYLVSIVPYTVYVYRLAISKIELEIPWIDILVFIIALLPSAYIIKILGIDSMIISSFWTDIAKILPGAVASAIPYTAISIALSKRLRYFVKSGLAFLKAPPS